MHTAVDPTADAWVRILRSEQLELLNIFTLNSPETITDRHFESIGKLANLRTLIIGSSAVTDETLRSVAQLPQLEALVLYHGAITREGLLSLARARRLETVGVAYTHISAEDVRIATLRMPTVHFDLHEREGNVGGRVLNGSACLTGWFLARYWWPLNR